MCTEGMNEEMSEDAWIVYRSFGLYPKGNEDLFGNFKQGGDAFISAF